MDLQKKTSKNPLFFAKGFQQVHGFNPPALHLTQNSLHGRIPGSRHGTGARHDLRSPASNYTKPGGKKSIQWMAVHLLFLFWGDEFFKPAIFYP